MQTLKPAALYFALVFGTGFALGLVRVPLLVPRLGVRVAELIEMPFMFIAIVLSARWVIGRLAAPVAASTRSQIGLLALAFALVAELSLAWLLQGLSPLQYVASRDPVSGSVYVAMLLLFAAMPLWVGRRRS